MSVITVGKGHWRNECPLLKRRAKPRCVPAKPSQTAVALRAEEIGCAIAAVRADMKPSSSELACKVSVVEQQQAKFLVNDEIDPGYAAFVLDGYVSQVGSDRKVPVKILRDSGALN